MDTKKTYLKTHETNANGISRQRNIKKDGEKGEKGELKKRNEKKEKKTIGRKSNEEENGIREGKEDENKEIARLWSRNRPPYFDIFDRPLP